MNKFLNTILFLLALTLFQSVQAEVKLPQMIRDGMVLQRETAVPIWGWADPGEVVKVTLNKKTANTKADENGKWRVQLPSMEAGGPYEMIVKGENEIIVKDILIGDVWFCSGQSNMVHQMKLHNIRYAKEVEEADFPEIRQFWVPTLTNLEMPQENLPEGEWKVANPENVLEFSAVAYFFAKKLYEKYGVPIGIINSSVGGTPIEAWMSEAGFKDFPKELETIQQNKDTNYIRRITGRFGQQAGDEEKLKDKGLTSSIPWYSLEYEPKSWKKIAVPGFWEDQGVADLDGVVWYRKEIDLSTQDINQPAKAFLGRIVDADELYINGKKVGQTGYQYPQRRYEIPENTLRLGKNVIVVRVTNQGGKGGFVTDKPYYLTLGKDTIDLKGYWEYKVGEVFDRRFSSGGGFGFSAQNAPTALYKAMVHPFVPYAIKGVLWYQGESNTGNPKAYYKLQPALIKDWRNQWHRPDLPFIITQLPGFMDYRYAPMESNWAVLRDAQLKALEVPHTAMAVTIDLGEWNDVHPDRKKPVGDRLALAAESLVYEEKIVASGPLYNSYEIKGNKIEISFDQIGSGLIFKDSSLSSPSPEEVESEFAIAGADKQYVWAQAKIEGDKVVVWSPEVDYPRYVRYAWADNPVNPNLYNKEGLPASPFSTDDESEMREESSLKKGATIPMGVAVGVFPMRFNPAYAAIVKKQFSRVTFENALKSGSVVKPDGTFEYSQADQLLGACLKMGLPIHGHNLNWYQQNSPYVFTLKDDSTALEHYFKKYIDSTATRYKGKIKSWDVVNEAFDQDGNLRYTGPEKRGYFYWANYLGEDYVARAFQYAKEADSEALLFYNDYNLEVHPEKLKAVVNMAEEFKKRGIPIDGLGTQMHISISTPNEGIDRAFKELAATGLLIHVSELDIKVNPKKDSTFVMTEELAKKQADKMEYILQSYFRNVPEKQRFGITFWNVGQRDSWIRQDDATLYDKNYQPKPMYEAVLNFFKQNNGK